MRQVVFYPDDVKGVPADAQSIHLVRPIKLSELKKLFAKCKGLKDVSTNESCIRRMPAKTKKLLDDKGVALHITGNRGRAIEVELNKMAQAIEMAKDGMSMRHIEKVTGIPKSTVYYLVRYAERTKIKIGKKTVCLV